MFRKVILVVIHLFLFTGLWSQETIQASIQDIIQSAQDGTPGALLAKTRLTNEYWRYVSVNSRFKPQLSLNGTLPSLDRSISQITLPDGSDAFLRRSQISNGVGINLSQAIRATGGSVFVSTEVQRLDVFANDFNDGFTSYFASPVQIGINQPLFQFNALKWDQQAADINYEASKKRFNEDQERLAFDAVNLFFDLYSTELNLRDAKENKVYLDSITTNAEGRFSLGRISETDLLQIQLSAKNADSRIARLELEVQNKTESLRDFLGIQNEVFFELEKPLALTYFEVDPQIAVQYALENRSITEEFRLRRLNAEREVERAQKDNGLNIQVNGSFGLTQTGPQFTDAYTNLLDQERLSVSIQMPIADWGRTKAQREIAKSTLELVQLELQQDRISFEREIMVNVEQFELKRNQLALSEEALDIAKKRLDIAKKRFKIGKIDVTNLNIAIQEEQASRQGYYAALWELWRAHYTIRNLTLYDFETKRPLK